MKQYAKIYNPYSINHDFVKIIGYDEETNSYKVERLFSRRPIEKVWICVGNVECIYLTEDYEHETVLDHLMYMCAKYGKDNIKIKVNTNNHDISKYETISLYEFIAKYNDNMFDEFYLSCDDFLSNGYVVTSICARCCNKNYTKFLVNPIYEEEW